MKKYLLLIVVIFLAFSTVLAFSSEEKAHSNEDEISTGLSPKHTQYLAAAIAIGCATIASGMAIGRIGSAAMGAISERPEASGSAIILAALAEGVCLWGFLIAFFILRF